MRPTTVVFPIPVHHRSTYSSSSVHCSSALHAAKCTSLLNTTAVAKETGGKPPGPHQSGGSRAKQAHGQGSHMVVGSSGSPRDVATLRRSGTAGSLRLLRPDLRRDCLSSCWHLLASQLLGNGRQVPGSYPPPAHPLARRQPRAAESSLKCAETLPHSPKASAWARSQCC